MFLVFIFCIFIVFIVFIVDVKNEMDIFIVLENQIYKILIIFTMLA